MLLANSLSYQIAKRLALSETPLVRIPSDVTNTVGQVLRVANQPIEIVALPKIACASKQWIDFARRKTLPTQNNFSKDQAGLSTKTACT